MKRGPSEVLDLTLDDDGHQSEFNAVLSSSSSSSAASSSSSYLNTQNSIVPIEIIEGSDDERSWTHATSRKRGRNTSTPKDVEVVELYAPPTSSSSSSSSFFDGIEVLYERSPLQEILDLFPEAKESYVKGLLSQHGNSKQSIINIVQEMAEKGYDKKRKEPQKEELDFSSTSWETTEAYRNNALVQLQNDFPYIRVDALRVLFSHHKHHYMPTLRSVEKTIDRKANDYRFAQRIQGVAVTPVISNIVVAEIQKALVCKFTSLKNKCTRKTYQKFVIPINVEDPIFSKEMEFVKIVNAKEQAAKEEEEASLLADKIAEETHTAIECECCCSEYAFENLVQCSEGHLFCKGCLQRYAETTLFANGKTELKCMNTLDDCAGIFSEHMLKRSLSEKVFAKFNEAIARDAIKAAKIDGLVSCHRCQYQCEMLENAGLILICPSCTASTCRLCGEESHVPLRCEENEKKGETKQRLTVEEAMSKARIRECTKCKTKFFKTEGCNKMACTCGAKICYICRKDITKEGYRHFCQQAHCTHKKCGRCRLFTDSNEDDRQAMREAGMKAAAQGTQGNEIDLTNPNTDLAPKVDVDKLLEDKVGSSVSSAAGARAENERPIPADVFDALRRIPDRRPVFPRVRGRVIPR